MESVVGLAALIVLGFLASHHFRTFFRKSAIFDQFLNSGFLFILLGVLLGPIFLNVLSPTVVRQLDPFIYLALGWIGFIVGIQFEWRLLERVPFRVFALAQLESIVTAAVLFGALLCILLGPFFDTRVTAFEAWTGAIILTICGTISSSVTIHYYSQKFAASRKVLRLLEFLVSLHVFIPLLGVAILFSFFHIDQLGGAHFSGWLWLAIHLIIGALLGFMMFYLLRGRLSENERLLLILGSITFAAGIAGYLHISPIVVCFIAGIVYANMPGFNDVLMEVVLRHAERPVYLMMLILAGSLWDFRSLTAWGFLIVYVTVCFIAKGIALLAVSKAEPILRFRFPLLGGVLAQGPLAIALIVGYEQIYQSAFLSHIVTAILAGAMLNEVLAGKLLRAGFSPSKSRQSA